MAYDDPNSSATQALMSQYGFLSPAKKSQYQALLDSMGSTGDPDASQTQNPDADSNVAGSVSKLKSAMAPQDNTLQWVKAGSDVLARIQLEQAALDADRRNRQQESLSNGLSMLRSIPGIAETNMKLGSRARGLSAAAGI